MDIPGIVGIAAPVVGAAIGVIAGWRTFWAIMFHSMATSPGAPAAGLGAGLGAEKAWPVADDHAPAARTPPKKPRRVRLTTASSVRLGVSRMVVLVELAQRFSVGNMHWK